MCLYPGCAARPWAVEYNAFGVSNRCSARAHQKRDQNCARACQIGVWTYHIGVWRIKSVRGRIKSFCIRRCAGVSNRCAESNRGSGECHWLVSASQRDLLFRAGAFSYDGRFFESVLLQECDDLVGQLRANAKQ